MSKIYVIGSVQALPGREHELDTVMQKFVDRVQTNEPGTIAFGFYRDDARNSYTVVETYKSSEAVFAHRESIGALYDELHDCIQMEATEGDPSEPLKVYGDPSPELRELYESFEAVFLPAHCAI